MFILKKKHSTTFDLVTTFITKILFLGGSFIISILLARFLGPEGKGIVTALFVFPNMMVSLADLGIRQASAYYIGTKKYSVQEVLSSSLLLWIITSVISVLVVLIYYLIPLSDNYPFPLILIGVSYAPTKILVAYFNGVLQGLQKISNMNMKFIIEFSARLLFVLLFVWIFDMGVTGAALATFLNMIAVLLYSGFVVNKVGNIRLSYFKGIPQGLFQKGIVFAIALFVLELNYQIDIIFLENMVSPSELGIYSVGVTLAQLIWQVPSAIGMVLFSRSANSKTDREASERSARLLRMSWIPIIVGSIIFWMGASFFVSLLYGQEFAEAGQVIRILLPGIILMVLFKILNADLAGRGNPLFALKIYLIALAINIVLNFILIPQYSIYGAAIASSISYTIGSIIFSISYHRATGLRYSDLFILNQSDIQQIKSLINKGKNKIFSK